VWRFKYLLIGMAFPALLGVAIYLTAPRIADAFRDAVRESAQDAVQDTFRDQVPATVEPGRQIVITERQLFAAMQDADDNENNFDASGYGIEITDGEVRITDDDRDRTSDNFVIASVVPQVVDGRLVLTDRGGFLSIFKSARDAIADEIEAQAELIFANSGVRPVSVTAENGRLVIVTEPIGGGAATAEPTEAGAPSGPTPTATRGLGGGQINRTPTPTP
jgi:hypothetical protein